MSTDMFETATRRKVRFESPMGLLTVEDLWDLPLTHRTKFNLDDLAKGLRRKVNEAEDESFVVQRSTASTRARFEFDLVKHVIDVKLEEQAAANERAANREKKDKLLAALERKQNEALENMSAEEIEAQLKELS